MRSRAERLRRRCVLAAVECRALEIAGDAAAAARYRRKHGPLVRAGEPALGRIEAAIARVFRRERLRAGWRRCPRGGRRGHVWHVDGAFGIADPLRGVPPPPRRPAVEVCMSHRRRGEGRAEAFAAHEAREAEIAAELGRMREAGGGRRATLEFRVDPCRSVASLVTTLRLR